MRTRLAAGTLAVLFGVVGAFAGTSGAVTFVPYHTQNHQSQVTAEVLAALSGVGAAVSVSGVVAGYGLLRAKEWAWSAAFVAAVGCVTTVAVFAAAMPSTTPSPVPGGPGVLVLLGVVAAAYGLESFFLLFNRRLRRVARSERSGGRTEPTSS